MKDKKGFTLVEIMIALFITTILIASVYFMFIKVFQMNVEQNDFIHMQDAMRTVSVIVEKDVRKSPQNIELDPSGNTITLYYLNDDNSRMTDAEGASVKYEYKLEDNKLYRNGLYLIDQIESFKLTNPEGFYVNLEISSKTTNREVKYDKKIYLRKN